MTLLTNNVVNFFKAQKYDLVYKIIDKIGMGQKPCLRELWGELMHEIKYNLREHLKKHITDDHNKLVNIFLDSEYFTTCVDTRHYEYEPYLRVACRNVVLLKNDDLLNRLFSSYLFMSEFRHSDIYTMLEENLPMKHIEAYIKIAMRVWGERPMMRADDIIKGYTESDGSINEKGIGLLYIMFKHEPICPDYRTCARAENYNQEAELKIYKKICDIYYEVNKQKFEEAFNAK